MKIMHMPLYCCLLSLCIAGCAGQQKIKVQKYECSSRVAKAVEKFKAGKTGTAKVILEDVKLQCAGHPVMDTGGIYLGKSLISLKYYAEAKEEFSRLMQDFPSSPYFEEANFLIAYCVFKMSLPVDRDQKETRDAIKLLRNYLETSSSASLADSARKYLAEATDKLAQKEFNSARFYQKMGEKEAAVICYKSFITNYAGSPYAAPARLNMGQLLIDLGRMEEAREVLGGISEQENGGEYAKKARDLLSKTR